MLLIKLMFSILMILLQLELSIWYTSSDIFDKTIRYIQDGKMRVSKNMNYFIFDESNYTSLDINGTEMNDLFLTQQELYDDYDIPNYIFVVDNQNIEIESLDEATHNLADKLQTYYQVNKNKAIILFLSIQTHKNRILTGESIKYIYSSYIDSMLSNLPPYLRENKYYEAWYQFLNDAIFFYQIYELNKNKPQNNTDYYYRKSSSRYFSIATLILCVIANIVFFGFIFCLIFMCCRKRKQNSIKDKISVFLRDNSLIRIYLMNIIPYV